MDDDAPVVPGAERPAGVDRAAEPVPDESGAVRRTSDEPAAKTERSEAERAFLIRQSMVGELEEFFPPEFLDRVKARFEARLAERDTPPAD